MLTFLRQSISAFRHTGAFAPSSRFLARAICGAVKEPHEPIRILEVGAGSGAFTRRLLELLQPNDELVVNEINPEFVEVLREKVIGPHVAAQASHQVTLVEGSILDVEIDGTFDVIVCGIPLSNFDAAFSRRILRRMLNLLSEGGELRYFEYAWLKSLGKLVVSDRIRKRLHAHQAARKVLMRRHHGDAIIVPLNISPARVICLPHRPTADLATA